MKYRSVQHGFFFLLLAITSLAFLGVVRDFLQPLFWAVIFATLFFPLFVHLRRRLGGRASLAAALTLLTIVLVVLLPLALIGTAVTNEAAAFYERVSSGEIDLREYLRRFEEMMPVVSNYMEQYGVSVEDIKDNLSSVAVSASRLVASEALVIGQNALTFTVQLFLMLYVLFFFLRDGEAILEELVRVLPLGNARERRLISKFAQVSRATIKGTLVVGVVQGTMGGLLFWVLGVPGPVFWGVIMTVLSLLPAVGSVLVWGPAALILIVSGAWVKGIVMIGVGTLIIGLVDNVLRPVLVSRDTQIPDFLVLLATLGGLTAFGLTGFVIGPIIAALFLVVWDMFGEEYADDRILLWSAADEPTPPEPAILEEDPAPERPAPPLEGETPGVSPRASDDATS